MRPGKPKDIDMKGSPNMSFARSIRRAASLAGLIAVAAAFGTSAATAGETQSVKAFAVIETAGNVLPSGPDSTRMVGTLQGPFFIDSGHGPVDAGNLRCIANMKADVSSGRQTGEGSCVLTARDGANLFADWTCEGVKFVGCRGDFTITGGDGRLDGVSGGGSMTTRVSDFAVLPEGETGLASTTSRGIVFWDEFVFVMP
jgi:hypothetical protein